MMVDDELCNLQSIVGAVLHLPMMNIVYDLLLLMFMRLSGLLFSVNGF